MKNQKKEGYSPLWAIGIVLLFALFIIAGSGCTSHGESGRLLGLTFDIGADLSVGEDVAATTTAKDQTEAGVRIADKPGPNFHKFGKGKANTSEDAAQAASWDTRF